MRILKLGFKILLIKDLEFWWEISSESDATAFWNGNLERGGV